nr:MULTISPECIES: hypothetical protein [unclassified Microcoleus]
MVIVTTLPARLLICWKRVESRSLDTRYSVVFHRTWGKNLATEPCIQKKFSDKFRTHELPHKIFN